MRLRFGERCVVQRAGCLVLISDDRLGNTKFSGQKPNSRAFERGDSAVPVLTGTLFGAYMALSVAPIVADDRFPEPGDNVPPFASGLVSNAGSCVPMPDERDYCALALGTLDEADGRTIGLYAGRKVGQNENGYPLWKVTDTMEVPVLDPGQTLLIGLCRARDIRHGIVVIADGEAAGEHYDGTVWAVRVDPASGLWREIDAANVVCEKPVP